MQGSEKKVCFLHERLLLARRPRVAGKVLALGAVADFGAQNYQYTTNVDAR